MMQGNIKMAWHAIRTARWRSLLTVFGIIIGITSVVTTVSLGQGVKTQVRKQVAFLGNDVVTIRPGEAIQHDSSGLVSGINMTSNLQSNILTDNDLTTVQNSPGVSKVVPLSIISGTPSKEGAAYNQAIVISTNEGLPDVLKHKVQYGEFFRQEDEGKNVAVIGSKVAHEVFKENVPIGKSFTFRDQDFIVRGVLDDFDSNPIVPGLDLNNVVFIPYVTGKTLTNNSSQMFQIFVQPKNSNNLSSTISAVKDNLQKAHGGQEDFMILTQAESLNANNNILNLLTSLVAAVAAISLFVGGIGIMNIMLVSVTERTHEIGIRKAIGATNRQILNEFMTEAMVLSLVGGVIGSFVAILLNLLIKVFTNLQPVITWQVLLIANVVALFVGVIFGVAPAMKAARKDPIEALRNE